MSKKYIIIKKNDQFKTSKELDEYTYKELKTASESLNAFDTLAFLANSYIKAKNDNFIYPPQHAKGKRKSCFGLKDSEFYDRYIEFVVSKVLRDMIVCAKMM